MASNNNSSINTNYTPAAPLGNQIVVGAQQEQPHGTIGRTRKATITGVIGVQIEGLQEEAVACTFRKEVDLMAAPDGGHSHAGARTRAPAASAPSAASGTKADTDSTIPGRGGMITPTLDEPQAIKIEVAMETKRPMDI